jgi:hypothetical protein
MYIIKQSKSLEIIYDPVTEVFGYASIGLRIRKGVFNMFPFDHRLDFGTVSIESRV